MDRENLQDFTRCIRGFLREIECYSMDMFDDMHGSSAMIAVDELEKAIITAIDKGVYETRSAQLQLEQSGRTCPVCEGTKYHPLDFRYDCPNCNGSGQVR